MTELTPLEKDVLVNGFGKNEYNDFPEENGIIWSWALDFSCEECKRRQKPGVVSSLVKKGIMWS